MPWHKHLAIGIEESNAWLLCMEAAIEKQPYEAAFKIYLIEQFKIPVERISVVSGKCPH